MLARFIFIFSVLIFVRTSISEEFNGEEIPTVDGVQVSEEDHVLVLTEHNFNQIIDQKQIILVEFYAPWCGHCKNLAPIFSEAGKILKEEKPSISLGKVDATIEKELAKKYDVSGYPTLFLFKKGVKSEYDGPRTAQGIIDFLKKESDPNYKPPPSSVLTLTKENFEDMVNSQDLLLVEFYAPWCGHCKKLEPEYERAARTLLQETPPIRLAKVDGTVEKELAEKHSVTGYPTMFVFRRGKHLSYNGPREETGIVAFMREQAKSPSSEVNTVKEMKKEMARMGLRVLAFFGKGTEILFEKYLEAANKERGKYRFLHSSAPDVLKFFKAKPGLVTLYQPEILLSAYEPERHELFNLEANQSDIVNFFESNRVPLVGERSNANAQDYKYPDKYPLIVVYYDVDFGFENRAQTQLVRKEVLKVAEKHRGSITFAISKEEDFQEELKLLGLEDSGEDVNVGYFQSPTVRYAMEPTDEFSSRLLSKFIGDVRSGKAKRQIKSQKVPKDLGGSVLTLVGSTFEQMVLDKKEAILVEFYAPWCGHCKKLEPTYEKLAQRLKESHPKEITVAKIDATANDFPEEFKVEGYPTLFYVAGDKKVKYSSQLTLEDLEKFVKEQLSGGPKIKEEL